MEKKEIQLKPNNITSFLETNTKISQYPIFSEVLHPSLHPGNTGNLPAKITKQKL